MKDIKQTLVGISPARIRPRLGNVVTALLFTAAAVTCSLTMWASPSGHGRALDIAETSANGTAFRLVGGSPAHPVGTPPPPLTIAPPFDEDYSSFIVGSVPGVPQYYGGLTFKYDDPNTLLVAGGAGGPDGRVYQITVNRDGNGHIVGYSGVATLYPSAESTIGRYNTSVTFGPDNVLFVARYPSTEVEQSKPGSIAPDKIVDLTPIGVSGTGCTIAFVPPGFPGAGSMKVTSWSSGGWYHCDFAPDGNGTFNIISGILRADIGGSPKGIAFVPPGSPQFPANSVLISQILYAGVATASLDDHGDPIPGTMQDFISGANGIDGACIDPVTGDFLFSMFSDGSQAIARVSGFAVPPTPIPTPTPTATATATPTATSTPTATASPTPSTTPTSSPTPTATPTPGGDCVLPQGYWMNHERWPVNQLQLGNRTYNRQELQSILRQPPRGNSLVQLARQEIAAKLNIATGSDGSCVAQTLAAADALIGNLVIPPVGNGYLPVNSYVRKLSRYNNGGLCAPKCDLPPEPAPSPRPTARPHPTHPPRP